MKKNTLMPIFGAVLVACASCSDEVPAIPASELYTREFVKAFGVMSPSQDWNAASRGSVSVTTDAPARVQVSAKIRGVNYLLANYSDVSGGYALDTLRPRGPSYLYTINSFVAIINKNGGSGNGNRRFQSVCVIVYFFSGATPHCSRARRQ